MSSFFNFDFIETKQEECNCLLGKKQGYKYKCPFQDKSNEHCFNNYIVHSNTENHYDVLFLTEYPEYYNNAQLRMLKNFIEKSGIKNYTIAPALRCYPKKRELKNPVYQFYKNCDVISKIPDIDKYKIIAPIGNALFGVTQCNHLRGWEDFCQHLFDMPTYFYDNTQRRVYPLPSFHGFMYEMVTNAKQYNLKFDYRFFKIQLGKIKQFIDNYYTERLQPDIKKNVLKTENEVKDVLLNKVKGTDFAFDIETTGLRWWKDDIICLTISNELFKSYFIDWKLMNDENKEIFNSCFLTGNKYEGNNLKFDLKFLIKNGVKNAIGNEDNMILHHLIYESRAHTLDAMTYELTRFGGYAKELEDIRKKQYIKNYGDIYKYHPDIFIKYSCYDSAISFYINPILRSQAEKQDLIKYYETVMLPSIKTFVDLEMTGIKVDLVYLKEYVERLKQKKSFMEKDIYGDIGEEINLKSTKEVSRIMRKLSIPIATDDKGKELKSKVGDYLLNKDTIPLYSDYPFIFKLIEYNHLSKLISQLGDISNNKLDSDKNIITFNNSDDENDFIVNESNLFNEDEFDDGFYKRIHNGILYPEFNLIGTKYGRISGSGGLNFQNWPKHNEGKDFRKLIIPKKNCVFAERDLSNAEMRIVSVISNDINMKNALKNNMDMHCLTASKVAKISYEEMFENSKNKKIKKFVEMRFSAKATNFGIVYGSTKFGLARNLNKDIMKFNSELKFAHSQGNRLDEEFKELITIEQAQEFIDAYFEAYPKIKDYIERYRFMAIDKGYIKNVFGRIAHLPELYQLPCNPEDVFDKKIKEYLNVAINCGIQGPVGTITLLSMNRIKNIFSRLNLKSTMLLQVHDSILFEIVDGEMEIVDKITKEVMETHYDWYDDMEMTTDIEASGLWGYGESPEYWFENPDKYQELLKDIEEKNKRNEN